MRLTTWRIPYLILVAGITGYLAFQCLGLRIDQDNRSMNADNETGSLIEKEFKELFKDNDPVLVAIHWEEILSQRGHRLIKKISSELQSLDGVAEVFSIADFNFDTPEYFHKLLFSEDHATVGILVRLREFDDNGESIARTIQEIRMYAKANSYEEAKVTVTGLPLQKYEVGRLVRADQKLFAPLSFCVLGGVLLWITKRFSGVFFPLFVCAITICWTLGIYALFGHPLNMITSLLPPVIMTLSITTTIHIYLYWLRSAEPDRMKRISQGVRELFSPCLFASLTTAIGFLSLIQNNTPAVRHFGIFAALGVMISFFLGFSFLVVGLSFFKPPQVGESNNPMLERILKKISKLAITHPWLVVGSTLILAAICCFGIIQVKSNTDILGFLGKRTQLFEETSFIDSHLTGVNTIELLISKADHQAFNSYDEVDRIDRFQKAVETLPFVRHCLSIAAFLRDPNVVAMKADTPLRSLIPVMGIEKYMEPNLKTTRFTIRTSAIGTSDGEKLIAGIRNAAKAQFGDDFVVRETGGFFRLIEESNQLVATQMKSFGIALVLILLSIGGVFRSFKYIWLSIIPNVTPILMTGAIMGFCHIDLSTGTTMIACVVIGVVVDDTIHYLARYRELNKKMDCDTAIMETSRTSGLALISTTLALSVGFWVAIFGSFQPTVFFALLSGLTMWFALCGDLLVLPACLKIADLLEKRYARL